MASTSLSPRQQVAREAATLLYHGVEKEYKQAKLKAAETLGVSFLPTNREVAIEIDRMAEENEGSARMERLVRMRKEAFKIMKALKKHDPVLVGSVWRGTIRHSSDLDIIVYNDEPEDVLDELGQTGLEIEQTEWVRVTKKGRTIAHLHIHLESSMREKVEIVVHGTGESCLQEKCEVYGDKVTGLRLEALEKVLKENPTQRFLPS